MVASIDSIKTKKASQLNTQLNVYKEGKTQAIQKIKSSIFNTDNQKLNANATDSIFNNPALKGVSNQAAVAQTNDNQNTVSNATSVNLSSIITKANDLINNVVQKFEQAIDNIKNSLAELSALASPQTTGQAVNPQGNMPMDNKGSENKAASVQDRQKPNVGFGQETVTDKSTTEAKEDKKADKEERESSTQLAQNASEIDKATIKKIEQQYDQHYQMGANGLDSIFNEIEDMTTSAS